MQVLSDKTPFWDFIFWRTRTTDKLTEKWHKVKTSLWERLDYFCTQVRIYIQHCEPSFIRWGILRVQPVVLMVRSSFSSAGSEPRWMTGWFTVFSSRSMLYSHIYKSMSQWWVTLDLCLCVTPETTLLPADTMTPLLHKPELVPCTAHPSALFSCTITLLHIHTHTCIHKT